jgi:glutathione peroxidase
MTRDATRGRTPLLATLAAAVAAACSGEAEPPSPMSPERAAAVAEAVRANRELAAAPAPNGGWPADVAWSHGFDGLMGGEVPLSAFAGKAVLVVNTASRCGFTPQYKGLQALYEEYAPEGLVVVGVPSNDFGGQEPGGATEIAEFCELNYGVTFPMTDKYAVTGESAHPFYVWAEGQLGKAARPGWNFHKVLIGRDGRALAAFPSTVSPGSNRLREAVAAALG